MIFYISHYLYIDLIFALMGVLVEYRANGSVAFTLEVFFLALFGWPLVSLMYVSLLTRAVREY